MRAILLKCVFYDPAVQVPLIVRPPRGRSSRLVDDMVEHFDAAATIRDIAGAPDVPQSSAQSLRGYVDGDDPVRREVSFTENWGFLAAGTYEHKLVVDEDTIRPLQLFDRCLDPLEDENLVASPSHRQVIEEIMEAGVRPFLATAPQRPHSSLFAVNPG